MLYLLPILLLISINILISGHFSPTWDFPMHLLSGQIKLGEIPKPADYQYILYGVFTDVIPLSFSRLFPPKWFPSSYLLFGVLIGSLGVLFFYLLLKKAYGGKTACLASLTLLLLPRFIGHLHTNIKDVATISFFIAGVYFYYQYLQKNKLKDAFFFLLTVMGAVNTKLSILQIYPLFFLWILFIPLAHPTSVLARHLRNLRHFILLVIVPFISLLIFILLWPGPISTLISSIGDLNRFFHLFFPLGKTYALEQLLVTTPLPLPIFAPFGFYVLWQKARKGDSLSFFFFILFFYTLLKYPILGFPVIDDSRYFLEIYFPLSLSFVLGVEYLFRKYMTSRHPGFNPGSNLLLNCFFILFIVYSLLLNAIYHPYQITYYNILATQKDPDFWAASYREVFDYLNQKTQKGTVVSARLAPELAEYYIRADLREKLNTLPPEESDIVVILNRPSFFGIFKVDQFFASHRPSKVITNKIGIPLSYIYSKAKL